MSLYWYFVRKMTILRRKVSLRKIALLVSSGLWLSAIHACAQLSDSLYSTVTVFNEPTQRVHDVDTTLPRRHVHAGLI